MWWHCFIAHWNGLSMMLDDRKANPDIVLTSDASGRWGCGALNSYIPPWGVVALHIGVISLPGGWSCTLVLGYAQHQCARPHPREGYNYYIICYLGNITVQERYGQHS